MYQDKNNKQLKIKKSIWERQINFIVGGGWVDKNNWAKIYIKKTSSFQRKKLVKFEEKLLIHFCSI